MIDHGLSTSAAETLGDLVTLNARAFPERPALTATGADGQETFTYRELDERTTALACGLVAAGVGKGDRVAFLMNNDLALEAVQIYSACHKAGAVAVPINGRLVPIEVEAAIRHAEVGTLIFGPAFADHAQLLRDTEDLEVQLFQVGGEGGEFASFSELAGAAADPSALPEVSPDDYCDWLYTSGTTGTPKCVMLSHANCVASSMIIGATLSLRVDDLYLTPFPFFTSSGTHTTYLTGLSCGAHSWISNNTRAEALFKELEDSGATSFGAVPAIYSYMLDCPTREEFDLSLVRGCWFGGAAINGELVRKIKRLFPRAEVVNIFGQTESGNPGTYLPGKFAEDKAGSIGRTGMPGVDVRVVDIDTGKPLEGAGSGELHLRSKATMQGYYANPEATATTIEDGWLRTGDLVMVDEDGFMYVHDRLKDIIIRGGHNVATIEVESAINDHPEVIESAVVAKPHETLGEDVMAYVVITEGGSAGGEELREFLVPRLADYKIPREWAFIEALPRNPTGKILKRELREQARERAAAQAS
jgi:acyl-CoA synthetase (AMP-forming)/AMP-acid ligase II